MSSLSSPFRSNQPKCINAIKEKFASEVFLYAAINLDEISLVHGKCVQQENWSMLCRIGGETLLVKARRIGECVSDEIDLFTRCQVEKFARRSTRCINKSITVTSVCTF